VYGLIGENMKNTTSKIYWFTLFFTFFFLGLSSWVHSTFGPLITLDQIIFHLNLGVSGNIGAEPIALWKLFKYLFLGPLLIFLFFFATLNFLSLKYRHLVMLLIGFIAVSYGLMKHDALSLVDSLFSTEDRFTELYQPIEKSDYTPPALRRNLILIYVESLETSLRYVSNLNVLEPLDALAGMEVNRFYQAPGTGWSIAGMISSQCAIPLKPFFGNKADKFATRLFLPAAVCLSDILADHGYEQIFLVGPELKFSGMDKFYSTHNFQRMYGRDELRKLLPETHFGGWGGGPNDDVLLDAAFNFAESEHLLGHHFNLTVITTDNHAPEGTPSRNCAEHEISGGYRGTFRCTSRIVRSFVDRIMLHPMYKNTDIFLMGDHLFMANEKQLKAFPDQRFIYFKYISSQASGKFPRDEMTHFDVAPTILDALGFKKNNSSAFGLGRSLFETVEKSNYTLKYLDRAILNRSPVYNTLWGEIDESKAD
jgi:phosphoglycerol transferase